MELTAIAAMLNSVFSGFDFSILSVFHSLQQSFGSILTPIATAITMVGEHGAIFLVFGLILLFFKKTRKAGIGIILAIAVAFVISSLCIKDVVDRPRPFEMSDVFNQWWIAAGAYAEDTPSFPSGHVAAAMAAMLVWMMNRRKGGAIFIGILVIALMACSRMYLICHYPSDVLGGLIVGIVAGLIGYGIVQLIWKAVGRKSGGSSKSSYQGYEPARGKEFNIPMGAAKPARAQGTSPFAAEALNDPMNFTAGGNIATNHNTSSFQAVPEAAKTTAFQAFYGNTQPANPNATGNVSAASTTAFQNYYGSQANPQAQNQAAQYNDSYRSAAESTVAFNKFYDSLPEEPQPSAAKTTAFQAYFQQGGAQQGGNNGFDFAQPAQNQQTQVRSAQAARPAQATQVAPKLTPEQMQQRQMQIQNQIQYQQGQAFYQQDGVSSAQVQRGAVQPQVKPAGAAPTVAPMTEEQMAQVKAYSRDSYKRGSKR